MAVSHEVVTGLIAASAPTVAVIVNRLLAARTERIIKASLSKEKVATEAKQIALLGAVQEVKDAVTNDVDSGP